MSRPPRLINSPNSSRAARAPRSAHTQGLDTLPSGAAPQTKSRVHTSVTLAHISLLGLSSKQPPCFSRKVLFSRWSHATETQIRDGFGGTVQSPPCGPRFLPDGVVPISRNLLSHIYGCVVIGVVRHKRSSMTRRQLRASCGIATCRPSRNCQVDLIELSHKKMIGVFDDDQPVFSRQRSH